MKFISQVELNDSWSQAPIWVPSRYLSWGIRLIIRTFSQSNISSYRKYFWVIDPPLERASFPFFVIKFSPQTNIISCSYESISIRSPHWYILMGPVCVSKLRLGLIFCLQNLTVKCCTKSSYAIQFSSFYLL